VAVAGVACLGIGLSLTWRTFEQAPDAFDAVPSGAPMAPAAAKMVPQPAPVRAPLAESAEVADESQHSRSSQSERLIKDYSTDAAKAEKKLSAGASNQLLREEPAADALQNRLPREARSPAASAPEKAAEAASSQAEEQLHSELLRLLKLRRDGWPDEADALLLQLMREHPELDIDAQLQQLQQGQ
jgi:hypothetical protein